MVEQDFNNSSPAGQPYQAGNVIGKYEVVECIGRGGQSIVYKCHDPGLDRLVAIKQIAPQFASDPNHRDQIIQTIRKIAQLGAANEAIVDVHEMIDDQTGLFYVMDFVEGYTLETLIREAEGPMEVKAFLMIVFRLAAALHQIHRAGVIHRDLKPGNIIMAPGLRPKVVDFGVAAVQGGDVSMPLATTKYMAPELYENVEPDGRADIYSLGFISYEMLASRPLFNEIFQEIVSDPNSESLRWMKWHGNEKVTAPLLHEIQPSVPETVSLLVDRMIQKDRDQRFSGAEELGRAIKTNFSSKARGGGAPGAGQAAAGVATGAAAGGPDASAAGGTMQGAAAAGAPSGDMVSRLQGQEGWGSLEDDGFDMDGGYGGMADLDQLDAGQVGAAGPETAPLPKKPMSKRMKIALASIAAAAVLGLVGFYLWKEAQKGSAIEIRKAEAKKQFERAVAAKENADAMYANGDFAKAVTEGFASPIKAMTRIRDNYPNTPEAQLSALGIPICRAKLAMAQAIMEPDYEAAKLYYDKSQKLEREARQLSNEYAGYEYLRERLVALNFLGDSGDLEILAADRAVYEPAHQIISAAREKYTGLKEVPEYEALKQETRDQWSHKVGNKPLPDILIERRDQVYDDIDKIIFKQKMDKLLALADQCMTRREYTQAREHFEAARDLLDSPEAEAIPRDREHAYLKRIEQSLSGIAENVKKEEDWKKLDEAQTPAQKLQAIKNLRGRPDLSPQERGDLTKQQKAIELQMKETALKSAATDAEKTRIANELLEMDPNNALAKSILASMKEAESFNATLKAAHAAYNDRNYSAARRLYKDAADIKSTAEITNRISECDFYVTFDEGKQLLDRGREQEAREKFAEAKKILPSKASLVDDVLNQIEMEKRYKEFIASADQAVAERRWRDARNLLDKAQAIKDTAEIKTKLNMVDYSRFVFQARQAVEQEQWDVAIWAAKKALEYHKGHEAESILNKAQSNKQMEN